MVRVPCRHEAAHFSAWSAHESFIYADNLEFHGLPATTMCFIFLRVFTSKTIRNGLIFIDAKWWTNLEVQNLSSKKHRLWTGRPGVLQFMGSQSWTQLSDWTEPAQFSLLAILFFFVSFVGVSRSNITSSLKKLKPVSQFWENPPKP